MLSELRAQLEGLGDRVSSPTQLRSWGMEYQAQLVELLPAILTALQAADAVEVAREALEDIGDWRQREVQAIGAAISTRNWHSLEAAYNSLRDKMDRSKTRQALAALTKEPVSHD